MICVHMRCGWIDVRTCEDLDGWVDAYDIQRVRPIHRLAYSHSTAGWISRRAYSHSPAGWMGGWVWMDGWV